MNQLNQPIDRTRLSWEALDPSVGSPLVRDGDNVNVAGWWNGTGFSSARPILAVSSSSRPGGGTTQDQWKRYLSVVLALCALGLGTALAVRFLRRIHS